MDKSKRIRVEGDSGRCTKESIPKREDTPIKEKNDIKTLLGSRRSCYRGTCKN